MLLFNSWFLAELASESCTNAVLTPSSYKLSKFLSLARIRATSSFSSETKPPIYCTALLFPLGSALVLHPFLNNSFPVHAIFEVIRPFVKPDPFLVPTAEASFAWARRKNRIMCKLKLIPNIQYNIQSLSIYSQHVHVCRIAVRLKQASQFSLIPALQKEVRLTVHFA